MAALNISKVYDVAIIGGGVAGSSLAASLARTGLGVIVFEREKVFRDRVRGEGVHPWGVAEAEKLGLLPVIQAAGANELTIWQIYIGGQPEPDPADFTENAEHGELAIYHPDLQEALLEHARAEGAEINRPAKVATFHSGQPAELAVTSNGQEQTIQAKLVVAADGRLSGARRWIGASTTADQPGHHLIGGCLITGVDLDPDKTHMGFWEGRFSLVYPQGSQRARAYIVGLPAAVESFRSPKNQNAFIDACAEPFRGAGFDNASPAGPVAFFPGENISVSPLASDNVVLIGDAAGATDPSAGHGLSLCFRDARSLRDLLLDSTNWLVAVQEFARQRKIYEKPIQCHARWLMQLVLETGPEADLRRARADEARSIDPENSGYGSILTNGPDGLPTDEVARQRFFGELVDE